MNKLKFLALGLALCLFTGCSLALPEADIGPEDTLCGVYVTTRYLDLYDVEGALNDALAHGGVNGDFELSNSPKYQGKLWGEVLTLPDGTPDSVTFPEEGYLLMLSRYQKNGEGHTAIMADDAFENRSLNVHESDTGSMDAISAALRVDVRVQDHPTVYLNPVYRTADGQYYLQAGTGISHSWEEEPTPDFSMSQTLEETHTETMGGQSSSHGIRIAVTVEGGYAGDSFTIVQLDGQDNPICREERTPEDLRSVELLPETQVVLIKTNYEAADGTAESQVECVTMDKLEPIEGGIGTAYFAPVLVPGKDGFCARKMLELHKEN